MRKWFIMTSLAALVFASGCGEPTRDERVMDIAQTGCDRFETCGEIGSDERYDTYAECLSELEGTFYDLWPADSCGQGQINDSEFDRCVDRAANYPCDSNFLDQLSYLNECGSGDVCIDPRD